MPMHLLVDGQKRTEEKSGGHPKRSIPPLPISASPGHGKGPNPPQKNVEVRLEMVEFDRTLMSSE
jgi:hypothetical protein